LNQREPGRPPAARPLPPPITEDEELIAPGRPNPPHRAGPQGPPPRAPEPVPEATDVRGPGSSARAALDGLEAKGLFLVRPPPSPPPPAANRPAAPPAPDASDWSLFPTRPTEPFGRPVPEARVHPTRRPPEKKFRAADELVDRLEGRTPAEGFDDFTRRFERPTHPHPRALETLFPPGVVRLFEARAWPALVEGFQRVVPSAPDEPAAWIGLALCALAQKDPGTSARLLDHALKIDDELRPDRLLAEALPDRPKDWLRLAEGLARLGHLDPAQEICHRVAGDLDRPDKLRRRAQRTRQKVRSTYYQARGECDPERLMRPVSPTRRALQALGTALMVLACLALAGGAYLKANTVYHLNRAQTRLAQSAYHLARLQAGDRTADRRGPVEGRLEEAREHLSQVRRRQPAHLRATFLDTVATEMMVAVGRVRGPGEQGWSAARRQAARAAHARATADLQRLKVAPEVVAAEERAWEEVRQRALRGQDLGY